MIPYDPSFSNFISEVAFQDLPMVWQEHTARMSALVAQVGIMDQTFGETIRPVIPTEHWWNDQHSALISELKAYQERVQKLFLDRAGYSLWVQMGMERVLIPILNDPNIPITDGILFETKFCRLCAYGEYLLDIRFFQRADRIIQIMHKIEKHLNLCTKALDGISFYYRQDTDLSMGLRWLDLNVYPGENGNA